MSFCERRRAGRAVSSASVANNHELQDLEKHTYTQLRELLYHVG